mmetsp:Transcript_46367/g.68443  ORF Transcript_46367/g.68443 Transcript_46367/m.68443 type:complete len:358 (-) Transcript_46367:651-1724(-)|eukprot:CAMPEP_0195528834 /NCGR_PEP_ID=MMETSP0794_2-20130614/31158_1 /TAXON_ID=515487 /ORGANISM="Stephanopyxis turris, Strain CCMP 815" /LENGTH=357 /DNA_ID=CAMNT_0040660033 /DNA_START=135 /DNA_END=1208 /DNA_ORIENTATION=+
MDSSQTSIIESPTAIIESPTAIIENVLLMNLQSIQFIVGFLLVLSGESISQSRWFHLSFGALFGSVFGVLFVLYLLWRQVQNLLPRKLVATCNLTALVVPTSVAFAFQAKLFRNAVQLLPLAFHHPVAPYYLGLCSALGALWVWKVGAFLPTIVPLPKRTDEGTFHIAPNGARKDCSNIDPEWPWSQTVLKIGIIGLGTLLVLFSTSSNWMAGGLIVLVHRLDLLLYVAMRLRMRIFSLASSSSRRRNLISNDEYEDQAENYTQKQLELLRKHIIANPDVCMATTVETEMYMRRFAKGRPHIEVPEMEERRKKRKGGLFQSFVGSLRILRSMVILSLVVVAVTGLASTRLLVIKEFL